MPTFRTVGRLADAGGNLWHWATDCCRGIRLLERLKAIVTFIQEARHVTRSHRMRLYRQKYRQQWRDFNEFYWNTQKNENPEILSNIRGLGMHRTLLEWKVVAMQGVEPRTLRIWAACSNQLSYIAISFTYWNLWWNGFLPIKQHLVKLKNRFCVRLSLISEKKPRWNQISFQRGDSSGGNSVL